MYNIYFNDWNTQKYIYIIHNIENYMTMNRKNRKNKYSHSLHHNNPEFKKEKPMEENKDEKKSE